MNKVETLFKYVSIAIMGFIILTVLLQIIAREVIYFPVSWTTEAAKYSFIWMSLIGAGLGIRKLTHVSIDLVSSMFSPKLQKALDYFVNIVVLILMLYLLTQSIDFSSQALGQNSPSLDIPMRYIYISLVIFSILGVLFTLERIVKMIRKKE